MTRHLAPEGTPSTVEQWLRFDTHGRRAVLFSNRRWWHRTSPAPELECCNGTPVTVPLLLAAREVARITEDGAA